MAQMLRADTDDLSSLRYVVVRLHIVVTLFENYPIIVDSVEGWSTNPYTD
jgi:hypothetical protein